MAQCQIPQLFGIIPTSHPCITLPTTAPSPTSYIYILPSTSRPFNHITVFLLPGITLPPNTAAAVYLSIPPPPSSSPNPNQQEFKFLGGIGPGKESAVFKISGLIGSNGNGGSGNGGEEIDMDAEIPSSQSQSPITLGISLESADSVAAQMNTLQSTNSSLTNSSTSLSSSSSSSNNNQSNQLILSRKNNTNANGNETLLLAQRIIKNAFNFLASFSGNLEGGVEVVPLKAFEEWWRKFEGRVRSDPGFLERGGD